MALTAARAAAVLAFLAGFAISTTTALLGLSIGLLVLVAALPPFVADWPRAVRHPFVIACLAFWGWYAISMFWSEAPSPGAMLMKLHPYAIAPALFALCQRAGVRRAVLVGFAAGAGLSLAVSLGSAVAQHPVGDGATGNWVVFKDHIFHNFFLALLTLGLIALWLDGAVRGARGWVVAAVVAAALFDMFFLVQGRTGQVVLLFMAGVLLVLWQPRRGTIVAALLALVVVPLLWQESATVHSRFSRAADEVRGFIDRQEDFTSVGMRLAWYRTSLQIIGDAPLLGHGSSSLPAQFVRRSPWVGDTPAPELRPEHVHNPHNSYLWVGIETGLIGMAALLGVFVSALRGARPLPRAERWLVTLLVGSMALASLANSLVMDRPTGTGFILLACALLAGPTFSRVSENSPGNR